MVRDFGQDRLVPADSYEFSRTGDLSFHKVIFFEGSEEA